MLGLAGHLGDELGRLEQAQRHAAAPHFHHEALEALVGLTAEEAVDALTFDGLKSASKPASVPLEATAVGAGEPVYSSENWLSVGAAKLTLADALPVFLRVRTPELLIVASPLIATPVATLEALPTKMLPEVSVDEALVEVVARGSGR